MDNKTIAIIGVIISAIGALDQIRKLFGDVGNWWNGLSPLAQWVLIGVLFYIIYKKTN